ncbi:MAG: DoxX family protein [Catalinimonas sp.]
MLTQQAPSKTSRAVGTRVPTWLDWVLRVVPALILLQTLFFKFTAHPDSVYLFTQVGVEPWGRITLGVFELIAAVLLLIPATARFGALISVGMMVGAIGAHLFQLGIVVNGDGGSLFALAVTTLLFSAAVFLVRREPVPVLSKFIKI